jgi:predicted CoA-binding protein
MHGDFLKKENVIAVVGASSNPGKWGHRMFRHLRKSGFRAFPVNPGTKDIDGERCFPDITSLPEKPDVVITVVRPEVTEQVVKECGRLGVRKVWMQPGSESKKAIDYCRENGIEAVHGSCYVIYGLKEQW